MKVIKGSELADYIKMRQVHEVRSLKQSQGVTPKLVINHDVATQLTGLKEYATDLELELELSKTAETDLAAATVLAMDWLLAGYNINLPGKNIVVVGDDLEWASELMTSWQSQTLSPTLTTQSAADYADNLSAAEVVVCAAVKASSIEQYNSDPKLVVACLAQNDPLLTCALVEQVIRSAS